MLFTGSKAVSMCSLAYLVFIGTLHVFSLTRLFPCLWISLFSLLASGHWQGFQPGAGLPWRNPCVWRSPFWGEKKTRKRKGRVRHTAWHVARGIPAGLRHTSGWWRSLCKAASVHCRTRPPHSSRRQGPGQLGEALQRTGKWFSLLMAHSEWLHGSPLLPWTTIMKNMSFP